jgi:hypothetical protein
MLSQANSDRPSSKLLVFAMIAFVLAISSTGGIALYLGAFNQPVLRHAISPDYHLIYLEHFGPYNEIKNVFKQAEQAMEKGRISPIAPAALFSTTLARWRRTNCEAKSVTSSMTAASCQRAWLWRM